MSHGRSPPEYGELILVVIGVGGQCLHDPKCALIFRANEPILERRNPVSDDDEEHARADAFSQGTGKITGREKEALKHINKRVAELKAQGVPVEEAFKKAYDEARNNPQRDWRRGES